MRIRQPLLLLFILSQILLFIQGEIINLPGLSSSEFSRDDAILISQIREEAWFEDRLEYEKRSLFNSAGDIESETFYDDTGKQGSRTIYIYDEDNKLVIREFHHPDAPVPDRETYVWDDAGRLFSVERLYTTGKYGWKFEYTYDDQKRLILVTKIDRYWKDVVVWEKTFSYDDGGRIISSEGGGLDENIHWYDEFKYDNEDNLSDKLKFDVNYNLTSHTKYYYDEARRVVREEHLNDRGDLVREFHYYYRNNEVGYWTEKMIGRMVSAGSGTYFQPVSGYRRFFSFRTRPERCDEFEKSFEPEEEGPEPEITVQPELNAPAENQPSAGELTDS